MPGLLHSPWGSGWRPTHHSLHPQLVPNQLSPSPRPPGSPLSRSGGVQHTPNTHRQGQEDVTYPRVPCRTASQQSPLASFSSSPAPPSLSAERAHCPQDTHPPGPSSSLLVHKQLLLLHQTTPNHSPDHHSVMTARARYWKPWSQAGPGHLCHLHEALGRALPWPGSR